MTETSALIERLARLKATTQKILDSIPSSDRTNDPVNWADLCCAESSYVLTDTGEERMEVLIEEAAPESGEFQRLVTAKLARSGFPGLIVRTEW